MATPAAKKTAKKKSAVKKRAAKKPAAKKTATKKPAVKKRAAKKPAAKKPAAKKTAAKKPAAKKPAAKKTAAKKTAKKKSAAKNIDVIGDDDARIEAGYRRLRAYWDAIGPSDRDVITYIVNPMFMGAPAWPNTRQAYRVVRPAGSLIIASDGLSDPFVGTGMTGAQGVGCEVYIEAPELAGADFEAIRGSWAFAVVELIAQNVAAAGGVSRQLEEYGVLSMEIPLPELFPKKWRTPQGTVGCLINTPVRGRPGRIEDMPFGPVDIVCATLVTPAQIARIRDGGREARDELVRELAERADGHASRLERA